MERRHRRKSLTDSNKYLIHLVDKNKFIYEWDHKDYKDDKLRKTFFEACAFKLAEKFPSEYSETIDVLGPIVKTEWYSLRDLYRRASAKFKSTAKLSGLMEEAFSEMSFLEKWIATKGVKKDDDGHDSDSFDVSSQVSDKSEHDFISDEFTQTEKLPVSGIAYLSEDEDAVLEFVKKESLQAMKQHKASDEMLDSASLELSEFSEFVMKKAASNTEMIKKQKMNCTVPKSVQGTIKEKSDGSLVDLTDEMDSRSFDEFVQDTENSSNVSTKKLTSNIKSERETFDKTFARHVSETKSNNVGDLNKLMGELNEQTREVEKLELVRDTVNLLTDILLKLPIHQYLLALDIVDNIFDKYFNLKE